MNAYAPDGTTRILGTNDRIPATAIIQEGSWTRKEDGTLEFDWVGDTDLHWDGQYTEQEDDEDVYVDISGDLWKASELILKDE